MTGPTYVQDKLAQVGLSGEHGQDVAILLVETRADTTDELADRVEHGTYRASTPESNAMRRISVH